MLDFIENEHDYKSVMKEIEEIFFIEKQLPNFVFKKEYDSFLANYVDYIREDGFFDELQLLTESLNEKSYTFAILDPSPEWFYDKYSKYPILNLLMEHELDDYKENLWTLDMDGEIQDSIFYSDIFVYFSKSQKWAIYANLILEIYIFAYNKEDIPQNVIDKFKEIKYKGFRGRRRDYRDWLDIDDMVDGRWVEKYYLPEYIPSVDMTKEEWIENLRVNYRNKIY